jgi:hypothetical protein
MALTKVSYSMIESSPVNVLNYGADSTGATDSTAAIQSAIDTGRKVFVPAGIYLVDSLTPKTSDGYLNMYGEEGLTELKGKFTSSTGITSTGVVANDGRIYLSDLIFNGFNYCIHFLETFTYTHKAYVNNCVFKSSQQGVAFRGDDVQECVIQNCEFENIVTASTSVGAIMLGNLNPVNYTVGDYFISDNVFTTVTCSGGAESHAVWVTGKRANINNNRITAVTGNSAGDGAEAIYVKVSEAYISNNIIVDGGDGQGAITIKGSATIVAVENNSVSSTAGSVIASSGFYCGGCTNLTVHSNYFEDLGVSARNNEVIRLTGTYGLIEFTSNTLVNCTGSLYTIAADLTGSVIRLIDNVISVSAYVVYGWYIEPVGTIDAFVFEGNTTHRTVTSLTSGSITNVRIKFGHTTSTYRNILISNNSTIANDSTGVTTSAMYINSTSDATISGVTVTGNNNTGTADLLYNENWDSGSNVVNESNSWNRTLTTVTNDATPTLQYGARIFNSANVSTLKTITDFDSTGAIPTNTIITLVVADAFTAVANGSGILLNGAATFNPTVGGSLSLIYNGTDWVETGRSSY